MANMEKYFYDVVVNYHDGQIDYFYPKTQKEAYKLIKKHKKPNNYIIFQTFKQEGKKLTWKRVNILKFGV